MDEMNKKMITKQSFAIDNTEFSAQAKMALKDNIDLKMKVEQLSDTEINVRIHFMIYLLI
jgi:hypothetical protein